MTSRFYSILGVALGVLSAVHLSAATAESRRSFLVREFGATGDGRTLDTAAVNRAIEAAAAAGGGTVEFTAGEYLCHSIRLKSHVELHIGLGATIIAADPVVGAAQDSYDFPEPNEWSQYQDFGHSHWYNSLIWGEEIEDIAVTGPGRIYGRGLSRGNGRIALGVGKLSSVYDPANPPDVLEADGPFPVETGPALTPGPFGYPNARDRLANGVGNKAIALKHCRNVVLRDFSILHGGHFGILATGADNLTIDNLTIDTNRDGMDIDACNNVRISNCAVNSPWDDGICLKSSHALGVARATENVTISNCFVSGYDEGTLLDGTRTRLVVRRGGPIGRIKLGTEAGGGFRNLAISNCVFEYCRGLALEQVDGGGLEDVTVSNVVMRDIVSAPIFIRLGARLRAPAASSPGKVRRILVNNLVASNVSADHGILIAGLVGHAIEDVVLANIQIHYRGGGSAAQAARVVPEYEKDYPDPYGFGVLPSWGIFARHVANLQLRGVSLAVETDDHRPAAILDDVIGARLTEVALTGSSEPRQWWLTGTPDLRARDCDGLPDANGTTTKAPSAP